MIPKSFSATALQTASSCLARYKAEHIDRSKGFGGIAANLGSAVHGALEMYVKQCVLEKKMEGTQALLLDFFKMSYMDIFSTTETNTLEYMDGVDMLIKWFKRTDFNSFEVLTCEIKENFPIPTSIGDIPFNFIWDRHDKLGDGEYRVVDYKTNKWGINPADLKDKPQARAYGLAAQIKYPDAKRIWVEFDMLRHNGPVGIVFTRDDNIATWKWIKAEAERIISADDSDIEKLESLNPECLFCPRSTSCKALRKNIDIGGVLAAGSVLEMVDVRAELEWQRKAVSAALTKLDTVILEAAKAEDRIEFETANNKLNLGVSARRAIDAERAEQVLPPEIAAEYLGKTITMAKVDLLLKGDQLNEEQKSALSSLIYFNYGEPRVSVKPRNPIDD